MTRQPTMTYRPDEARYDRMPYARCGQSGSLSTPHRPRRILWIGVMPLVFGLLSACGQVGRTVAPGVTLVDAEASPETRALYANLLRLAPDAVLFGHQDDLAYGVTWVREQDRSDVKEVTGSYPAVYGWELGDLELSADANLDDVRFDDMKGWIKDAYKRGGVVTLSWHLNNPVSGGDAWDQTPAVAAILPGGPEHETYTAWLDRFADFADDLTVGPFAWLGFGKPVPVLFRPFHEMTGSWFWWGADHCTPEEYRQLWRFTVDYLRDEKGLHHLLYTYSPDRFETEAEYLERYPGDAYVDVLGYDDYFTLQGEDGLHQLSRRLATVVRLAEARGKLPAFTETGYEGIPDPTWWTNRLLAAITSNPEVRRIAYVLVWRNANTAQREGHYYAPYPGHPSAADFVRFYQDPFVLFEDELPDLYRWPPEAASPNVAVP